MSEKEQKQWYVIRAIGGKEKKVKEYIETEVQNSHLEDYISQVLIPTEKVYQIKTKDAYEPPVYRADDGDGEGRTV